MPILGILTDRGTEYKAIYKNRRYYLSIMNHSDQTKSLKELVNRFIESSPFQRQLTTAMVRVAWHKTMPKVVWDRTEKLYTHENKLFLKITSAPLRHELKLNKDTILTRLHEAMSNTVLQDIVFL